MSVAEVVKTGELSRIIFQKPETGFMIASFSDQKTRQPFTALGQMIDPQPGVAYKLIGTVEQNAQWGEQLKIIQYETVAPVTEFGIYRYITKICKFVGPAIGNRIIDTFGKNTLSTLKEDPERVAREIPGITPEKASQISETLKKHEQNEKLLIELGEFLNVPGMFKNMPEKVLLRFQSDSITILKKNPYQLTVFPGVGFLMADRVAIKNGLDPASIHRKKAVCLHCIKEEMQTTGSVWIPERVLLNRMKELVPVTGLDAGIKALEHEGLLASRKAIHNTIRSTLWAMAAYDHYEMYIAEKVGRFAG